MSDILFTGANSFAGGPAFNGLVAAGHRVVPVSRRGVPGHEFASVDLSIIGAEDTLPNRPFDVLVHFASVVPPVEANSTWAECAPVNVEGTIRLLKWAEGRVGRIVLASSSAVYGVRANDGPVTESSDRWPDSYYGLSKLAQEDLVRAFCQVAKIPFVILRLGYVYGPGMRSERAVVRFLDAIQSKRPLKLFNPDHSGLTLIHTQDIAEVVERVLTEGSGVFNLTADRHISIREIYQTARDVVGHETPVSEEVTDGALLTNWYSVERLSNTLGWSAKISLSAGIQSVFEQLAPNAG